MSTIRRVARTWPLALLLLGLGGCFNPFAPLIAPTTGVYIPPPTPNTPQGVIRLFEWCWRNRDITLYREIFTADFLFVFALGDSAGNQFRENPVNREKELDIARNLFVGGGSAPPATSISLNLDPTLRPLSDSRDGKDPKWHKEIVTGVDLTIKTEDGQEYRIMGNARFFVVRGDSALIPSDLSFRPDSNRWYIDQWNDETLSGTGGGVALQPAGPGDLRVAPSGARMAVAALERVQHVVPVAGPRPAALSPTTSFTISWGRLNALYAR